MDNLASEVATLVRHSGISKPFGVVDLKKWVPQWAAGAGKRFGAVYMQEVPIRVSLCACLR